MPELRRKKDGDTQNSITIFVDGAHRSWAMQWILFITLFLIAPLGILNAVIVALKDSAYRINVGNFVLILFGLLVIGLILLLLIYYRRHWVRFVEVDDKGIRIYGFLKKENARWEDIISIDVPSSKFGVKREALVRLSEDNFYFPLTMQQKDIDYPKLILSISGWEWIGHNGDRVAATVSNCPLYVRIQESISRRGQNV